MVSISNRIGTMFATVALLAVGAVSLAYAQTAPGKLATEATKKANQAVQEYRNFNDRDDFENAAQGLIAKPDTLTIKGADGKVVWDLEPCHLSVLRKGC